MAKGDYVIQGTGTISASLPGEYASVTVTATGAAAGDIVMITETSNVPRVASLHASNTLYVSSVTTNAFVVKSSFKELTEDVTFSFIVFDSV